MAIYLISEKPLQIHQKAKIKSSSIHTPPLATNSGVFIDYSKVDPYSYESGVVTMSCGHLIGKTSMRFKIKALISCKKYEIRCGY